MQLLLDLIVNLVCFVNSLQFFGLEVIVYYGNYSNHYKNTKTYQHTAQSKTVKCKHFRNIATDATTRVIFFIENEAP